MKPSRPGVLTAFALVTALLPLPGAASDGYGCPKLPAPTGWRTPGAECRVKLQGLPITVYGNAMGVGAEVHVSLVIPTFTDVLVLECSATDATTEGSGYAECSNVLLVDQDLLVPLPEGTVRCRVDGKTSPPPAPPGDYFCQTGTTGLPVQRRAT